MLIAKVIFAGKPPPGTSSTRFVDTHPPTKKAQTCSPIQSGIPAIGVAPTRKEAYLALCEEFFAMNARAQVIQGILVSLQNRIAEVAPSDDEEEGAPESSGDEFAG